MSPWASASSATLRGEPPGPDRPQAREPRPQEGVAGRRHDLVHHGQRAEPSGATSPWQTLAARPARPTRQGGREPSGGARAMCGMAQALQVPRPSSGGSLGSRSARMRSESALAHTGSGLQDAPGRGQAGREPPTTPRGRRQWRMGRRSRRPGKPSPPGGGLLAQALRQQTVGHQGTQRTRQLSPGHPVEAGARGKTLRGAGCPRRAPAGAAPCAATVARPVLNGEGGATGCGTALCPYPTPLPAAGEARRSVLQP